MNLLILAAAATLPTPSPSEEQGKIVMYRQGAITGAAIACPIRYDGREVVELARNRFVEWPVPAGDYVLTNKTSSVEVRVAPGQVRYVRCQIKMGMLTGRADLQIVDRAAFEEHARDYEPKKPEFTLGASR